MTYTDVDFRLEIPDKPLVVHLAPDLVLQMLDKLIANAMDFSMPSSPIEIRLTDQADRINLDVINYGQTLPDEMGDQLFNSMISVRNTNNNGKLHLGLGLYISRLIAEFHGGEIMAHNLDDKSGVCFTVIIRLARKIP
jgi:K+-sensing histidine kinase KdpD